MKILLRNIGLFLLLISPAFGQNNPITTRAVVIDGDTVPVYVTNEVKIFGPVSLKNKSEAITFSRLVRNVKKVYPYAKITSVKAKEYDEIIRSAKTDRERRQKMKVAEDELREQFEGDIRNLTFSQGVLLIKLIDRETGNTSYDLISEFRGKLLASMYQTIGRLFGYNLKTTYDPQGEDKEIEKIVQMIESGAL